MLRALAVSFLLVSSIASARTWAPRTDVEVVALDLATGALKWSHKAGTGNAHYELFPNLLVAYPHYDNQDKTKPIFLDPKTGAIVKAARAPKTPIKRSSAQWVRGAVVLPNGWRNDDFRAGYVKSIAFTDSKKKKVVWTIPQAEYPDRILAYKDHVLVVNGQRDVATLDAYKAGATKPTWSIDFNAASGATASRLSRISMELIGDVLYTQSDQYVFAIDPATGKVIWKLDAAAAAKLSYSDLYGGALDLAVFSRDGDTLVAAFEKRVFAIDAKRGALLWHLDPDTFPHAAFPLAHDGVVYLTAGPARSVALKPTP